MVYVWGMATSIIQISRETDSGRYAEIIDVCDFAAKQVYGSASNALCAIIKNSELFKEFKATMEAKAKAEEEKE